MSGKMEKAPAGAGTLARAAGTTAGRLSSPCTEFTMTGERGQVKIAALLGRGQSTAVPLAHLVAMTGADGRTVRRQIEAERRRGVPILSDNCRGYFLPADDTEIAACVGSLRRRAGEIMKTASAIEKVTLAEDDGQIELWDGGGRCG